MNILGRGVYDIAEAARLTRLRTARVREWFRGRTAGKTFTPVFQSDYPAFGGDHSISFLDLIELFIAGQLREMRVSLQYIRKVYKHLETEYGKHPFCSREIFVSKVDKKKIFTRGLDESESRQVIQALTNQPYFEQIILPFLRQIDYDKATNLARRWHYTKAVVVDPAFCFGKPIVESVGITTNVLASSYFANKGNVKAVARWFEIEESDVLAAVEFETMIAA
ncbi:MAG: DUF433 domain-containing protein [Isosphaeraceae bacterium]